MGGILKRWKREESAEEVLGSLEKQLQRLELTQQKNEQRYQRLIGFLMFYSIIFYITVAIICYFYYFPKQWKDMIIRSIPLLIFPLLIVAVRKILHYYFSSQKRKSAQKCEELRTKRQKVIEDVKEKETYKKAKEILEKFDPDSSLVKNDGKQEVNNGNVSVASPGNEMRQRNINKTLSTPNTSLPQQLPPSSATPMKQAPSPFRGMSPAMQRQFFINNVPPGTPPGPPKPIQVIPKERTTTDKFVDYLVGDGPNNRYALICKYCHSHNGMALMEDFEYTTFRCYYCYNLNEAKKQRPSAPPLEGLSAGIKQNSNSTAVNGRDEYSKDFLNASADVKDNPEKENVENSSHSYANEVENISAVKEATED